ncbi:MAG: thiamine pyrophosphate-dependent dehydrogenase E1 component subunit alpha [Alphaproteobacteria bacterium]|nr:thiamine pyrophosphate-dependent dehydrogenase E1 component subunit alpha [Alphaproteobacteria bacterium]MDP6566685.1 thiamine pyrophosphate-dependent dehydrogenase E1 component subunit alpha [Alphaproteobacteria bacterium]MDP6813021.1 thiamine pyrophosphate-dependent dehydrogenase E1 component subunit alpha [Alphaproteobacteria bacterium]
MRRIRAFEEAAEAASLDGRVGGAVHLSIGQEAVAAGVCANLRPTDQITTTHRGHGHCIAKGTDPGAMMLELFGKEGGTCGGKGGSMHIADFDVGMLGANGVVAAGIPIAVGAAHGAKLLGEDRVVVCFFGDGAINRGPFLEGLNWAGIFALPILFVCEHNSYASTTRTEAVTAGPGATARAESLGIEAFEVDGNDVVAVDGLAGELTGRIRAGGGPFFVTARTYRLKGHTSVDPGAYRDEDEVSLQWAEDPMNRCEEELQRLGLAAAELETIGRQATEEMAAVAAAATAAPHPALIQAFTDVQDVGAPVWSALP